MSVAPVASAGGSPHAPIRLSLATIVFSFAFIFLSFTFFKGHGSADFLAGWMAGLYFGDGQPHLIYPPDSDIFTMLPPPEWLEHLEGGDYNGTVYPFLYPPLWAWLASQLSTFMSYEQAALIANILNPTMIIGSLILAHSIVAPSMNQVAFVMIGAVALALSSAGFFGLYQNQPQILVSFLTVLAIERSERNAPRVAGLALALAAALKLYPAILVVFWLALGRRKAAMNFVIFGAMLGLASLVVGGMPLHWRFLELIETVSGTAMVTTLTYAPDSLTARFLLSDDLTRMLVAWVGPDEPSDVGWYVAHKPALFKLAFGLVQLAAIATIFVLFRRRRDNFDTALWPFALTVTALTGPMAWAYYYIAPLAFLPVIFARLSVLTASAITILSVLATTPFLRFHLPEHTISRPLEQSIGTFSMIILAVIFYAISVRFTRGTVSPQSA